MNAPAHPNIAEAHKTGIGGSEMCGDGFSRCLISFRRGTGEGMRAAMDVGIHRLVVRARCVQNRQRFLRRGRIIEIDQRTTVDLVLQDREKLARWQRNVHARSMPRIGEISTPILSK